VFMGLTFPSTALRAEVAWLRAQNEKLTDALLRLARKEHGMTEAPVERKQETVTMPPEVYRLVNAWDSPHMRERYEAKAIACYRKTKDWGAVVELLKLPEDE
jgi:hypothetical protein